MLSEHLKGNKSESSKKSNNEKTNGSKSTNKTDKSNKKKKPLSAFFLFSKEQRGVIR